jgi:hypothetical protein
MIDDLRWEERPATTRAGRVANTSPPALIGNVLVASIFASYRQHTDKG